MSPFSGQCRTLPIHIGSICVSLFVQIVSLSSADVCTACSVKGYKAVANVLTKEHQTKAMYRMELYVNGQKIAHSERTAPQTSYAIQIEQSRLGAHRKSSVLATFSVAVASVAFLYRFIRY